MNLRALFAATVCFFISAIVLAADPAQDEFGKLRGTWIVVSVEFGGRQKDLRDIDNVRRIVFADGKVVMLSGRDLGEEETGAVLPGGPGLPIPFPVRLNPMLKPKAIDLVHTIAPPDGEDKSEELQRGIYALERDRLKLCLGWGKDARPTEFATKAGSTTTIYVCQREQAETPLGEKFQPFTSEAGRFVLDLPGKPREQAKNLADGKKEHQFIVPISQDLVFFLSYIDLEEKFVKGKEPQERLKTYRRGSRRNATIEGDTEITLGQQKVPGRDYWLEAEKGKFYVRERLYLDGVRLYCLYVGSDDKAFLTSKDAERFFVSFQIDRSGD